MKQRTSSIWLGVALIALGVLALLRHAIPWWMEESFLWGTALLVIAAALFLSHRQHPRRGLPFLAWIAVGLAATVYLDGLGGTAEDLQMPVFFLFLALGFLSFHSREAGQWWGALVGGLFFVISIISATARLDLLEDEFGGALFFFGMALVFWYLYLIRTEENQLGWAKYVALASFLVSAFIFAAEISPSVRSYFWPSALILAGLGLILRDLLRKPTFGPPKTDRPATGDADGVTAPDNAG